MKVPSQMSELCSTLSSTFCSAFSLKVKPAVSTSNLSTKKFFISLSISLFYMQIFLGHLLYSPSASAASSVSSGFCHTYFLAADLIKNIRPGELPFQFSAQHSPLQFLQALLKKYNSKDLNEVLSRSVDYNRYNKNHVSADEVSFLLLAGANLKYVDAFGFTPLVRAVMAGQHNIVELLLARARRTQIPLHELGISKALFFAKSKNHNDVKRILEEALLKEKEEAPVLESLFKTYKTRNLETIVIACMKTLTKHRALKVQKDLEFLLSMGAFVDAVDSDGKSALLHAVFREEKDIVVLLVKAGADPLLKDKLGQQATDYAVAATHHLSRKDILQLLFSQNPSKQNKSLEIFKILMAAIHNQTSQQE